MTPGLPKGYTLDAAAPASAPTSAPATGAGLPAGYTLDASAPAPSQIDNPGNKYLYSSNGIPVWLAPGEKDSFLDETVKNPIRQVGAAVEGAAAGANHLTANIFDLLDSMADRVSSVTGMKKGDAFKAISDWARGNQAAEERQAQALSGGRTDLPSELYRGVTGGLLSVPTAGVAAALGTAALPEATVAAVPAGAAAGFAGLGALQESDRGWWPALKAAAEGALTGLALQVMGPASRPVRLTGAGAMTYAQARLNGADNATALANATTMGALSSAAPGGMSAKEILSNVPGPSLPTVKSTLNPVQQSAVDYLQGEGVPLNAGTVTGNRFLKGAQALVANTPLGAGVAADATRATEAGLTRLSGELADQAHPAPVSPESAGSSVSEALKEKIEGLGTAADAAYGKAWAGRNDPQYTYNMPVRTEQVPVLDGDGKPTGATQTQSVMKPVNMPVDIRDIKVMADPLREEMSWSLSRTDQSQNEAFNALDKLLHSDDFVPAPLAERGLSALKTMARTTTHSGVRNAAQGAAAFLIKDLQDGIDAAVAHTGNEAIQGLQNGRALHASKMEVSEVADQLKGEPVQNFGKLVWQNDTGIAFLRKIAQQAPDVLPQVGRAYLEKLFGQATQEGGFSRAQGIAKQWENLGPETKKLLYPNPGLRSGLDNFFLGAKMAADNPNPSGTALVNQTAKALDWGTGGIGGAGLYLHSPWLMGAPVLYQLGMRAIAKLLYSPAGVRLLTGGLKPEAPGAAALREAQILRITGNDDVTPIPAGGAPPAKSPTAGGAVAVPAAKTESSAAISPTERAPGVPREVGPLGPVYHEFYHDPQAALKYFESYPTGDAIGALQHPAVGDIDLPAAIATKLRSQHPEVLGDLQGFISPLQKISESPNRIRLGSADGQRKAVVRLDYDGVAKRWLVTAFEKNPPAAGRSTDIPGTP